MVFSDRTSEILKSNGWYEERIFDTSKYEEVFKSEGVIMFESVRIFLRKYGGLKIKFYIPDFCCNYYFYFDPIAAKGIFNLAEYIKDLEEENGVNAQPIGEFDNDNITTFMTEDGKVFGDYGNGLELFAEDGEKFIEFICNTKYKGEPLK